MLTLHSIGDDQIKRKDGTILIGQILSVSNGQAIVSTRTSSGGIAKLAYAIADFDTVTMTPPADLAKVKGAAPADVIKILDPLVKQFAGLPTDWVVDAMAQLADAYTAQGQADLATSTYNQIDTLYPNSKYHLQVVAGKARMSLQQNKTEEALAMVQPIIDQANKDIAPSQAEGGLYATAFLVYGQALEAQKKPEQALEAYLTVKTMFYQNPTLAEQADQLAKKLRDQNPGVGVE